MKVEGFVRANAILTVYDPEILVRSSVMEIRGKSYPAPSPLKATKPLPSMRRYEPGKYQD